MRLLPPLLVSLVLPGLLLACNPATKSSAAQQAMCPPTPTSASADIRAFGSLDKIEDISAAALVQPLDVQWVSPPGAGNAGHWATQAQVLKVGSTRKGLTLKEGQRIHYVTCVSDKETAGAASAPVAQAWRPTLAFVALPSENGDPEFGDTLLLTYWVCRTGSSELSEGGLSAPGVAEAAARKYGL